MDIHEIIKELYWYNVSKNSAEDAKCFQALTSVRQLPLRRFLKPASFLLYMQNSTARE